MFSSYEFHAFMEPLGIQFLPCSTGAPWSNGAAERAVQTIKLGVRKFVQQENAITFWDEYVHFFTASHNKSTSVYGYAPEELHFGVSNPSPNDLFQLWPNCNEPDEYMNLILPKATKARQQARERQEKAMKQKITYRNIGVQKKTFMPGQVVVQRNLQLATGPGKAMQPKYNGPYVIVSLDKDGSSALLEHMHSNQQVRAHFSNISLLNYSPEYHRAPQKFDEQLLKHLPDALKAKQLVKPRRRKQPRIRISQLAPRDEETDDENVTNVEPQPPVTLPQPTPSTSRKLELIIPGLLPQKQPNKEQNDAPQIQKLDIIIPEILLRKPQRLELQVATPPTKAQPDPPRRSSRLKKPPDKLPM
jgi:hypothetical protein